MAQQTIEALVFDLGGVLFEISEPRFKQEMVALAQETGASDLHSQRTAFLEVSHEYERGNIPTHKFLETLQADFFRSASSERIIQAWNSILVGGYPGRKDLIDRLASSFPIYLLSNTNALHFEDLKPEMQPVFEPFQHLFLSFEMKARKPEAGIYQQVTDTLKTNPERLLFIDDSEANIQAAQAIGYQTLWLPDAASLEADLAELLRLA